MRDTGSIVLGWLGKIVLVLGLLGLAAYDGVVVLVANFSASDRAAGAAGEAADSMSRTGDVQKAYDAAVASVGSGDTVEADSFAVGPQGRVTLFVQREANTLWLKHIGPLKKWTQVRQSGTATPGA